MRNFGGMMSFTIKGNQKSDAYKFFSSCRLFKLAESLGGVESLMSYPADMSHAAVPQREREKSGVTDSLVRLSVGIEDAEDLIQDIDKALKQI